MLLSSIPNCLKLNFNLVLASGKNTLSFARNKANFSNFTTYYIHSSKAKLGYSKLCVPCSEVLNRTMTTEQGSNVIFRQLLDYKSYTYTYLLGDRKSGEALLIDPVLEMVDRDIGLMQDLGLKLKFGVNTHVHADHVSGTKKLKDNIPGCLSALGRESGGKADVFLEHGDTINFGPYSIEARSTPGHTNGCMSFVWHDQKMVFTGDAVLIRGCGRTDFQDGDGNKLYTSVHSQIFSLPDDYLLYPAHDYTGQTSSTVGEEKRLNRRLTKPKEEFAKIMLNLNLPYPKQIDRAVPANMLCGAYDTEEEAK